MKVVDALRALRCNQDDPDEFDPDPDDDEPDDDDFADWRDGDTMPEWPMSVRLARLR